MTHTTFERVGLLGFGTMGAGIAQVVAQSGRTVTVLETEQSRIDAGLGFVSEFLDGGVRRGKITESGKAEIIGRVTGTTAMSSLAGVDLVIEAVTEDHDVKATLLADVAAVAGEDAVIVTNTSALSVTDLAASVPNPARFAGLHFFNPAPLMSVVEVVRALQSGAATIESLTALVESFGKNPVVVKDRPGFLVNSLLMPYLNDVVQAYDDELASAGDIDVAVKLGLGHKLGPLELLDLIGLDVHHHATSAAYQATLDAAFAPPPLLSQMVAAGYHGNKNGKGFHSQAGEVR